MKDIPNLDLDPPNIGPLEAEAEPWEAFRVLHARIRSTIRTALLQRNPFLQPQEPRANGDPRSARGATQEGWSPTHRNVASTPPFDTASAACRTGVRGWADSGNREARSQLAHP